MLDEENPEVKSKIIWAIGKLADGCHESILNHLIEFLNSPLWKLKSVCLYAISSFGPRCSHIIIPHLKKMIYQLGVSVNKQTIAETLIKLGDDGESIIINYLFQISDSDYKLKSSLIKSLGTFHYKSKKIDFVSDYLLKYSW